MLAEIRDHFLYLNGKRVEFKKTPNIGRGKNKLQYLIQHYTATVSLSSPVNWLTNPLSKVSAHLIIGRKGEVFQLAPFDAVCWHAGKSEWNGIEGLNEYSIGIEIVNAGILGKQGNGYISADNQIVEDHIKLSNQRGITAVWQLYTEKQIDTVVSISKALQKHYRLKDILGHEDVSPIRKTDPGPAFPWKLIKPEKYVLDEKENFTFKVTTNDVNLRVGSSTTFNVISVIPKGTQVKIFDIVEGWSKVEVNGITGYLSSKYLT